MKKSYFLLSMFLYGTVVMAQDYQAMPTENAVWNFSGNVYCFEQGSVNVNYSIMNDGDTTIGNMVYHKLNTPYIDNQSSGSCDNMQTGYKGAWREDVQAKIVYFVPPMDSSEYLLYDFNLQIGETLTGYTQMGNPEPDQVIDIDSVMIGNSMHKRWYVNDCYQIYWIEGLGSSYGFFEKSRGCTTDGTEFILDCFKKNESEKYPGNQNCEVISSVVETQTFSPDYEVFPNPSNGVFSISIYHSDATNMRVVDLQGKEVYTQSLVGIKQASIPKLPSGVYVLTIKNSNNMVSHKRLVAN